MRCSGRRMRRESGSQCWFVDRRRWGGMFGGRLGSGSWGGEGRRGFGLRSLVIDLMPGWEFIVLQTLSVTLVFEPRPSSLARVRVKVRLLFKTYVLLGKAKQLWTLKFRPNIFVKRLHVGRVPVREIWGKISPL